MNCLVLNRIDMPRLVAVQTRVKEIAPCGWGIKALLGVLHQIYGIILAQNRGFLQWPHVLLCDCVP